MNTNCFAILAVMIGSLAAQTWEDHPESSFDDRRTEFVAKAPPGVVFQLALKDSTKRFHIGQPIALLLRFSSTVPGKYKLNCQTYDRSGRLFEDGYCLDPADGAVDPMADYFASGGRNGGGLTQLPELTQEQHEFSFDLNEWARIDKPGKYRLYAQSTRILDLDGNIFTKDHVGWPAVSNVVEFEMLPRDENWEMQQLKSALAALDAPGATAESRRHAWRAIDYLGTEQAAKVLLDRFGKDPEADNAIFFGLFSNPHRGQIVAGLEQIIDDPNRAVTPLLMLGLVRMRLADWERNLPKATVPSTQPRFGPSPEVAKQESEFRAQYAKRLEASMPVRTGSVKDISKRTLAGMTSSTN